LSPRGPRGTDTPIAGMLKLRGTDRPVLKAVTTRGVATSALTADGDGTGFASGWSLPRSPNPTKTTPTEKKASAHDHSVVLGFAQDGLRRLTRMSWSTASASAGALSPP
jgi:hypothetical protein